MTDPELFPKDATDATGAANAAVAASLPLDDPTDRGLAERGRVATGSVRQIPGPGGAGVVWDLDAWAFLDAEAPPTVNPSLWRQSQLCAVEGLFEVVDGIWQVRGFDLSNVTFSATPAAWPLPTSPPPGWRRRPSPARPTPASSRPPCRARTGGGELHHQQHRRLGHPHAHHRGGRDQRRRLPGVHRRRTTR